MTQRKGLAERQKENIDPTSFVKGRVFIQRKHKGELTQTQRGKGKKLYAEEKVWIGS